MRASRSRVGGSLVEAVGAAPGRRAALGRVGHHEAEHDVLGRVRGRVLEGQVGGEGEVDVGGVPGGRTGRRGRGRGRAAARSAAGRRRRWSGGGFHERCRPGAGGRGPRPVPRRRRRASPDPGGRPGRRGHPSSRRPDPEQGGGHRPASAVTAVTQAPVAAGPRRLLRARLRRRVGHAPRVAIDGWPDPRAARRARIGAERPLSTAPSRPTGCG